MPKAPHAACAPALAVCLLLLLSGGGYWVYFLPTAKIDIDINPSVALSINRFNKVLSVEGYNAGGQALAAPPRCIAWIAARLFPQS